MTPASEKRVQRSIRHEMKEIGARDRIDELMDKVQKLTGLGQEDWEMKCLLLMIESFGRARWEQGYHTGADDVIAEVRRKTK